MKLFIVAFCLATAYAGRLENTYLPPGSARTAGGGAGILAAPARFGGPAIGLIRPAGSISSGSVQPAIPIIRASSEVNVDGSFRYEYESANGIAAHEEGSQRSQGPEEINDVHGAFSYTGDDGVQYSISYTANDNGFVAQGAHIPTAPPIPEEIQRALEQNAIDEANGIVDDGSYRASDAPARVNRPAVGRSGAGGGAVAHGGYRY